MANLEDASSGDEVLDNPQAKRKRVHVLAACDPCRRRKVKCDGQRPICLRCSNANSSDCTYSHTGRTHRRPRSTKVKLIGGLEERVRRMEALFLSDPVLAELAHGNLRGRTDSTNSVLTDSMSEVASPHTHTQTSASNSSSRDHQALSASHRSRELRRPPSGLEGETSAATADTTKDTLDVLVVDSKGQAEYIGSSAGLSIFSPRGMAWVNEKAGDPSFASNLHMLSLPEVIHDIDFIHELSSQTFYHSLPPLEEARELVDVYFRKFNVAIPLFNEQNFMSHFENLYLQDRDAEKASSWWASINVVFALAYRIGFLESSMRQDAEQTAWAHLKNAMRCLNKLVMYYKDLFSVQALLGMALFLSGSSHAQQSSFLVASAVRLAQSMGMHREESAQSRSPLEAEQWRRCFWIGYQMDKNICIRFGKPPVQDDEDMTVNLPSAAPSDDAGNMVLADGSKINLFRLGCTRAMIEGKIYRRLYSARASRLTANEMLNAVGELDQELEEWKESLPSGVRLDQQIYPPNEIFRFQVTTTHLAYYNCIMAVHRMSIHHGYWMDRKLATTEEPTSPNPRVLSSAVLCLTAARASIKLASYIPQWNIAATWIVLGYCATSFLTLAASILQNPHDPRAALDLKLMKMALDFFSLLKSEDPKQSVDKLFAISTEFQRLCERLVEEAQSRSGDAPLHDRPSRSAGHVATAAQPQVNHDGIQSGSYLTANPGGSGVPQSLYTTQLSDTSLSTSSAPGPHMYAADLNYGQAGAPQAVEAEPFMLDDFWQLPMNLEWDWGEGMNFGFQPENF